MTSASATTLGFAPAASMAGGVQANGARADAAASADAAEPAGGFDRMLQAQPRAEAQARPSTPSKPSGAPDTARSPSSKAPADTDDTAPSTPDASAESATATPAAHDVDTTAASDANDKGNLPSQLLALLNGLMPMGAANAAATATATATEPTATALPASSNATATPVATTATLPMAVNTPAPSPAVDTATPAEANADDALAALTTATVAVEAEGAAVAADGFELPTGTGTDTDPTQMTLPTAAAALTTRPVAPASAASPLQTPVDLHAGFDDDVSSRIVWMAEQRIGQAEIRVTPEHLGPIDVRLQLDGQRVSAEFLSAQPEVRHALEASLPRLRDLLGQQGLQLAQADVGQRHANPGSTPMSQPRGNDSTEPPTDTHWSPRPAIRLSRGLLDEYA